MNDSRHNAALKMDVALGHLADARQVGGTHYKDMPMQPWDVMQSVMSKEEFIGFLKGNIIKYSMRAGQKAGASDDGEKAMHYRQKLNEITKGEAR